MNLFYLHKEPQVSATLHCDKHVVKMIIEYAQMLSTAHRMLDGTQYTDASSGRRIQRWRLDNSNMDGILYKVSHINHPSTRWVRENAIQYQYAYDMFAHLCDEYTYRYKVHMTDTKLRDLLNQLPKNITLESCQNHLSVCLMTLRQKALSSFTIINTTENTKHHLQCATQTHA